MSVAPPYHPMAKVLARTHTAAPTADKTKATLVEQLRRLGWIEDDTMPSGEAAMIVGPLRLAKR